MKKFLSILLVILFFLSGCVYAIDEGDQSEKLDEIIKKLSLTLTPQTAEAILPQLEATSLPDAIIEAAPAENIEGCTFWIDAHLPKMMIAPDFACVEAQEKHEADLLISSTPFTSDQVVEFYWVYVLVAPFFTLDAPITFDALIQAWAEGTSPAFPLKSLAIDPALFDYFTFVYGETVNPIFQRLDNSGALPSSFAIIPFDALTFQSKAHPVDGQTPTDDNFNLDAYPLKLPIYTQVIRHDVAMDAWSNGSNFKPGLKTSLLMTGVTALVRATAAKMERHGVDYPAGDIMSWLLDPDFTHISNEISFASNCQYPNPVQEDLVFCSSPDYIQLLDLIDADFIELSGNHIMDWGTEAAFLTFDLYDQFGMGYFAGGREAFSAQQPLLVAHQGNQFALIGCNYPGPPNNWATKNSPGSANCEDFEWVKQQIHAVTDQGYNAIITIQYYEDYTIYASSVMKETFQSLVDAGAVIVLGTQAHAPKEMSISAHGFIHYGLGNLFFDQMEVYYESTLLYGTRHEFLDRFVFYDNKLIQIDLFTAMLEDYARPRPMTEQERDALLREIWGYQLIVFE